MKEILIATRNKGKAKEFAEFFQAYEIHVQSLLDLKEEIPDIEETGTSFHENAQLKAEQIAKLLGRPVLADDSGLAVDVLDGAPGIFSARYAGEGKSDQANYEKLLHELAGIPEEKRTARFICVLAIHIPGEDTVFYEGSCEGLIAQKPKGSNGFGYDPVFIPKGYDKTMAELPPQVKNKISHRSHAFRKLKDWERLTGQS